MSQRGLCLWLGACALAGSLAACGGQESRRPAKIPPVTQTSSAAAVERLSLRRQVGELLVLSFRGVRMPDYVGDIMRDGTAGGVILFGENVRSPPQLRSLTGAIQRASGGRALVSTDQEGGRIRIVPFAAPTAGQPELRTAAEARAQARAAASQLRELGINVNLAPLADVPAAAGSAVRSRAFAGDPATVGALVRASVGGYAGSGVAATPKHFPGFGAATASTDERPVTIDRTASELRAEALAPFRAAITAGAPLVMAAHALYPALDPRRIASQSPLVLDGLLRRELGFDGAIVTDSIEAAAVRRRSPVETAAVRSIAAGADLILMTGPGSFRLIYPRLLAEARRSPAFRKRVRAAAARVLELKRGLGLRPA